MRKLLLALLLIGCQTTYSVGDCFTAEWGKNGVGKGKIKSKINHYYMVEITMPEGYVITQAENIDRLESLPNITKTECEVAN